MLYTRELRRARAFAGFHSCSSVLFALDPSIFNDTRFIYRSCAAERSHLAPDHEFVEKLQMRWKSRESFGVSIARAARNVIRPPAAPARRSLVSTDVALVDGRINHGAQFTPDRVGARRQKLRHEDRDQLLARIDPERRAGGAAPGIFTL